MEGFDWKFGMQLASVIFAAGVIYGNLKSFRADYERDKKESWEFRTELKRTLFGADGRNGLVGDSIKHSQHIEFCQRRMDAEDRRNG